MRQKGAANNRDVPSWETNVAANYVLFKFFLNFVNSPPVKTVKYAFNRTELGAKQPKILVLYSVINSIIPILMYKKMYSIMNNLSTNKYHNFFWVCFVILIQTFYNELKISRPIN